MSESSSKVIKPGTVFDQLTVGAQEMVYAGRLLHLCMCTCGASLWAPTEDLLNGRARACGWTNKDPSVVHQPDVEPSPINIDIYPSHVRLIFSMLEDGGKRVEVDEEYLDRKGIQFRPLDPRSLITDIHFYGLIRKNKAGGWNVTARGTKWVNGIIRVRYPVCLDGKTREVVKALWSCNRSVHDVMEDESNA